MRGQKIVSTALTSGFDTLKGVTFHYLQCSSAKRVGEMEANISLSRFIQRHAQTQRISRIILKSACRKYFVFAVV